MNDEELDRRLGALLREPIPAAPDEGFVNRVVAAARIDRDIRIARRRAWRRALRDCAGAVAVAVTFFLLTQAQPALPDGMISLYGPSMAGLVMLGLWALVALPATASRPRVA
jgi:hypothetical protein